MSSPTWYLDTSAALKLMLDEAESAALEGAISTEQPRLVGCRLLETEARRAVQRSPDLAQISVSRLLARIDLYDVPASVFTQAGLLPGVNLRSLDALHLASAIAIGVDAVLTYDTRMQAAAEGVGLNVLAPREVH